MKKRVGVKRSLQHPQLKKSNSINTPRVYTDQKTYDKFNSGTFVYYDDVATHEKLWLSRAKKNKNIMKWLRKIKKHMKGHMAIFSTPYIKPIFDFKNLRIDKKGHIKKIKKMQENIRKEIAFKKWTKTHNIYGEKL